MLFFDPEEAKGWVALHGSQTQRRRALALTGSSAVAVTVPPPGEDTKSDADEGEGLLPALERLKRQELETHRLLMRMKKEGSVAAVLALQDMHLAEIRALAKTESAAIDYRTRIGELGPVAELKAVSSRIIVTVKNAVLGIPSSAAPLLMPFLRDAEMAHQVYEILDRLCRDALRAASERHTGKT